jgi:antitoxin (DNA-binding transcriptional repressor) of toxin-antitoxin stability system
MQFGIAQAKARLSELTSLVDAGEEVVIAKHGRPGYKLVALSVGHSIGSASSFKGPAPIGLQDLADYIAKIRAMTKAPKSAENFVAQWRQGDRY